MKHTQVVFYFTYHRMCVIMSSLNTNQDSARFRQSLYRHAVLAQYFRWFQIYERPFTDDHIKNQLGIFSDDVLIESIFDTAHGTKEYQTKLAAYVGSTNAHHVKSTDISLIDEHTLQLRATVLYQGIRDNKQNNSHISYHALLALKENDLPCFTHMKLTHEGDAGIMPYQDAYLYNRAASLMHYWLYLMEAETKNVRAFRELLSDDFVLNLSDNHTVSTWSQFEAWLSNVDMRIKKSAHIEKDIAVTDNADGTISMQVTFDWHGLTRDDQPMIATTQHTWLLHNDSSKRFAQIKTMSVKQIVPFQVRESA